MLTGSHPLSDDCLALFVNICDNLRSCVSAFRDKALWAVSL